MQAPCGLDAVRKSLYKKHFDDSAAIIRESGDR